MVETELEVGRKVRWKGGLLFLVDWYKVADGKIMLVLAKHSGDIAVGNNVLMDQVELVRD